MKSLSLSTTFILIAFCSVAQTTLKEHKAGHVFTIGLPTYMSKTIGLNDVAAIQYKSEVKDVAGFVIFDTKEELALAELSFVSIREFYDSFMEDFLVDQERRKVSEPVSKTIGGINFIEADMTYYDEEAQLEIYYLVGVVETKKSYYKVLSWSAAEKKDTFKSDFQKIVYSLKD
jgi:hypothetical protein